MASAIKKTSGRYHLILINLKTKRMTPISCDPLSGKILFAQKINSGVDLPVLDMYILNHFSNEENLCSYLRKIGYPVTEEDVPKFSYQHNGITKYLDLIYQNPELCDFAFLFFEYKNHFKDHAPKNKFLKKALRKIISEEIIKEPLWKQFYNELIDQIHDSNFFSYIVEKNMLGERAMGFIMDYLNNEKGSTKSQIEAFLSAKYYLSDTFTAYKPIRGMIVARSHYFHEMNQNIFSSTFSTIQTLQRKNYFTEINPWKLLTEEQLQYLEAHSTFCTMSKSKQEDIILTLLGFTDIPWYQRTLQPLNETQIAYLEDHSYFCNLSYKEKIKFVDCCQSEIVPISYQKKKVQ